MKKRIIQLMLFASIYVSASAQTPASCPADPNAPISEYCEDGHGISTDPDNLVNDDCPNLKNDFEWRVKHTQGGAVPVEHYQAYDGDGVRRNLYNPFNDANNSDYSYLAANHGSNYHPEDGWELLRVDFGALSNFNTGYGPLEDPGINQAVGGKKLPYFILYNKYTGTFRFFGALLGQNEDYKVIKIELRIPKTSPSLDYTYQSDLKATNLLSVQGETVQPLDEETKETSMEVFATATNNENRFFWFDIPVAYDPCLCNIRSQLDVTFRFVSTAQIDIKGGQPKTGINNSGTGGKANKLVPTVFAAVISTVVAVKTGGTVINFKAYADLIGLAKDIPGLSQTQKDVLEDLGNFAKCGANFAKVVKSNYEGAQFYPAGDPKKVTKEEKAAFDKAEKLLDGTITFASALTTGCAGDDKAGTTVTGAFVAQGTWTEENTIQGTEIKLAMPGSKWSDKQMQINDYKEPDTKVVPAYPAYNERLGTFALLETPEIRVSHRGDLTSQNFQAFSQVPGVMHQAFTVKGKVYRIEPQGTLKYVFNPLLNVNLDESQIEFRFATKQNLDIQNTGLSWHGVNYSPRNIVKNDKLLYNVSTPFLPIDYYETFGPIILPLEESSFVQTYVNSGGNIVPAYLTEEQPYFNYTDSLFIQFKILMTSNDVGRDGNNEAYYLFTYPVKVVEDIAVEEPEPLPLPVPLTTQSLEAWNLQNQFRLAATAALFTSNEPSLDGANQAFNQDIIFPDNDILFYDGLVEISAKMSAANGKKVTIYSTLGFELLPGAEVDPSIELVLGYPFTSSPIPPQTYNQVSSFCGNTNKYKAQTFAEAALKEEEETYLDRYRAQQEEIAQLNARELQLSLYPNPTQNSFTVQFDYALADVTVAVVDINGKQVYTRQFAGEHTQVTLDATQLEAGVYFIDVRDANGKVGRERLVKY